MEPIRLKCNSIGYRKGFIEVSANIHPGCINLETWDIESHVDISGIDIRDEDFPGATVQANSELELDVMTAEKLVEALQLAITAVKVRA
jgi:hypothetical protein